MKNYLKRYDIIYNDNNYIKYKISESESIIYFNDNLIFNNNIHNNIKYKSYINCNLSLYWFSHFKYACPINIKTSNVSDYPHELKDIWDELKFRTYIVNNSQVFPFKCHVYGYVIDEHFELFKRLNNIYGYEFDENLIVSQKYKYPLCLLSYNDNGQEYFFNINDKRFYNYFDILKYIEKISIQCYNVKDYYFTNNKNLIPVNMVFQFGIINGEIYLVDAVNLIDDIIYWEKEDYVPGMNHYDYKNEFLENNDDINNRVIDKTIRRYFDIFKQETNDDLLVMLNNK